jgi:uncharacterized membrane protein
MTETTYSHFATCLGDTLASELGILSPTPPRLVTNLQPCRPGTNGGVSPLGLAVSIMGGTIMGVVFAVDLMLENGGACRIEGWEWVWKMIGWGSAAGLIGSLVNHVFRCLF